MNFIQAKLNPLSTEERALLPDAEFEALKQSDLSVLIRPYLFIGIVLLVMIALILLMKMPKSSEGDKSLNIGPALGRLVRNANYREGVIAQFFYVGAQIMCWTFIIQYGTRVFMERGMAEQDAEVLSQTYNIVAMAMFCCSRFICTYFLKFVNASKLLGIFAVAACVCTIGTIVLHGVAGLYCLVGISICMSLMFPTIYGIALDGLGEDAKFGAAGLIMAILGGSVLPPVQAAIIDCGSLMGMPAVNISFVLPLICFVVVAVYARRTFKRGRA